MTELPPPYITAIKCDSRPIEDHEYKLNLLAQIAAREILSLRNEQNQLVQELEAKKLECITLRSKLDNLRNHRQ